MFRFALAIALACLSGSLNAASEQGDFKVDSRRGSPAEYDPGPAKDSAWIRLFGEAPNYRQLGTAILGAGEEKFRWQFGPMWYRGRLAPNQVKVFVVGQEGAQDENISNRSFTGSTGTKTQKFLNHIGINKSYLFMNTFVYTINGQLGDTAAFKWMEQGGEAGLESPIVAYRHRLFDNMAATNRDSLALIIGVGTGGKASVATWINARGGRCSPGNNLAKCDTKGLRSALKLKNDVLVVGVPHPGGASPNNGGLAALKNIISGFTKAGQRVGAFMAAKPDWLPTDPGYDREQIKEQVKEEYQYGNAPIPFRDFAFGTNWRMGDQGTTSNRQNGGKSIQVFSEGGSYNATGEKLKYNKDADVVEAAGVDAAKGFVEGMGPNDLAFEPPRYYESEPAHAAQFDYGPCGEDGSGPITKCALADLLQTWPNFYRSPGAVPISDDSLGHGPVYRGRADGALVVVLADQFSHDDFFSARALTGKVGQQLQTFLKVAGVGDRYFILRTLPVDTLGLPAEKVKKIAQGAKEERDRILRAVGGEAKAVVILGEVAEALAPTLPFPAEKLLLLASPRSSSHPAQWDETAEILSERLGTKKQGSYRGQLTPIARHDLPVHSRWWMGTSGDRAARAERMVDGEYATDGNYYKVWAPNWVAKLRPRPLPQEMLAYIAHALAEIGDGGRTTSFIWNDVPANDNRFFVDATDDYEFWLTESDSITLEGVQALIANIEARVVDPFTIQQASSAGEVDDPEWEEALE